ncbi:MAG: NAD(P)H-binding protein [Phycisphaerales bacterium JB052]
MSESHAQTVAITGGTGFVGRHIVARLLGEGYRVRALTRSAEKAGKVFGEDSSTNGALELCHGTLGDPDALRHLVDGCASCIHLVGIIRETRNQSFEKVHVDGTRAIVETCRQHEPGMRYVHMSALGVGPDKRAGYRDSKHRAEQIVQKSGLGWTIVRPGLIHGPDGEFTQMAVDWVRGKAPPYLFLPYFSRWKKDGFGFEAPVVAPVYVEDVARVFVEALGRETSIRKTYELSGSEQLRFPEMLKTYARHLSPQPKDRPAIGLPWFVAGFQARVAKMLGLGGLLPFDEGMAIMGGRDSVSENASVIADFGFTPAEFEASLHTYADQL